ncbi:TNF receptor-associated factor 5-like isoform X2 [Halichondria panicea]|uniref:TNF receptor-associated factor 5-like isoform X2 n=1 Tax=Halichondria panicea TaxID=6063 RepID=UPI00312B4984
MASKNRCVAEPDQSPPHVVQEPPTNETAELDYDFVEQPDQDYFCPVSLELLVEPHQTSCCGHHVSQQAANRLIREQKPCPMCKDDEFNTQSDKYFKRKIRQLKVRCPHKKSGCEWTGELGDLNHHTTSCPKRPWKCQYCDHESIYETGPTDHTPNCPNYPLSCPNQCEIGTLSRCQADSHLLECPLQLVECEFASTGCDVKVPRRDLAGHMTENAQHHLMTATLLNLRLTKELHKKMEEKDQQIVELKQQVASVAIKTSWTCLAQYKVKTKVMKVMKMSMENLKLKSLENYHH